MSKNSNKLEIIEIGRRLYDRGFIAGTDGNISIKLDENKIMITPSGYSKGFLNPENLIIVDTDGGIVSGHGKPSSEILMHLAVYRRRQDIFACCHAHPPYITALSTIGKKPPVNLLPEAVLTLGEIAMTGYAPPGTPAVAEALETFLEKHLVFILKNHGVLTVGKNLEEAYNRMETVEHLAKIFYIAARTGEPELLDDDEVSRLENIRLTKLQGSD